jgi:hypothetical protein
VKTHHQAIKNKLKKLNAERMTFLQTAELSVYKKLELLNLKLDKIPD